jgi:ABC-type branched-chain amino acid transport systems, periplasmic component
MKRALYLLSVLLLASFVVAGCGKKEEKTAEAPKAGIKIGSLGPLTGQYAADGNDIKNGVMAAIEVMGPEMGALGPHHPAGRRRRLRPAPGRCRRQQAHQRESHRRHRRVLLQRHHPGLRAPHRRQDFHDHPGLHQ